MVEKVIRYKYPSCVHTNYQREHRGYNTVKGVGGATKFEPWNVEKEHKIIKYPRAETTTQNMRTYKNFKVKPKPAQTPDMPKKELPYPVKTTNQQEYQNWGPTEIIHEKVPQYPYYALPFRGDSTNNTCYQSHSAEKIKTSNGLVVKGPDAQMVSNNFYRTTSHFSGSQAGMPYVKDRTYETTNQNMYKPFKVKHHHRPVT